MIFFSTVVACHNKCSVYIQNLEYQNTNMYSLRQVYVTIATEQTFTQSSCESSHMKSVSMHIDCSSWNKGKFHTPPSSYNDLRQSYLHIEMFKETMYASNWLMTYLILQINTEWWMLLTADWVMHIVRESNIIVFVFVALGIS